MSSHFFFLSSFLVSNFCFSFFCSGARKVVLCFAGSKALLVTKAGVIVMTREFTEGTGPVWLKTLRRVSKSGAGFVSGLLLPATPDTLTLRLNCFVSSDLALERDGDPEARQVSQAGIALLELLHPQPALTPCPFELFSLYKMVHSDNSLPLAPQPAGLVSELVLFS